MLTQKKLDEMYARKNKGIKNRRKKYIDIKIKKTDKSISDLSGVIGLKQIKVKHRVR